MLLCSFDGKPEVKEFLMGDFQTLRDLLGHGDGRVNFACFYSVDLTMFKITLRGQLANGQLTFFTQLSQVFTERL